MSTTAAPRRDPLRTSIRVVGVAALLALLVVSLIGGGQPLAHGQPAPATRGTTLTGAPFDLAAGRGSLVVVNVWATWCAPCLHELPDLVAVARKNPDVRFVGLAAQSDPEDIAAVVDRFRVPYAIVPIDDATATAWNATAFPSTYVLGPAGTVEWSVRGPVTAKDLQAVLDQVRGHAPSRRRRRSLHGPWPLQGAIRRRRCPAPGGL